MGSSKIDASRMGELIAIRFPYSFTTLGAYVNRSSTLSVLFLVSGLNWTIRVVTCALTSGWIKRSGTDDEESRVDGTSCLNIARIREFLDTAPG